MKNCKHVVIFGLDAVGGEYMRQAKTPNIDRLLADGATTYCALASRPTSSPQGWGSILTGTSATQHRIYYPAMENDLTILQPTIFSYIRQAFPDAVMGSFCEWGALNTMMLEEDIGIYKQSIGGEELVENVSKFMIDKKPTLLYTHFDTPDHYGHTQGFGTVPYYNGIALCDKYVGQLLEAAERAGMTKENTLFIVASDHGGYNYRHGWLHDFEKFVFTGIAGCGVEHVDLGQINIRDLAAVVLHALDIPLPAFDKNGWTAQVPAGLFSDGSGVDYKPVVKLHRNMPEALPACKDPIEFTSEKGLGSLFGEKAPILALSFDDTIADNAGNFTPVQCYREGMPTSLRPYGSKGTRHIPGGVRGECLLCDIDGYLSVPDLSPGADSFSAAFWFYLNTELGGYNVVFSNVDQLEDEGVHFSIADGEFVLAINRAGISAKLGRNPLTKKFGTHTIPEEFDGGWMHVVVSVSREQGIYRTFCGFEETGCEPLPESLAGNHWGGCGDLHIGMQAKKSDANSCGKYMLDDFLWFDRALDEKDIEILRNYYL